MAGSDALIERLLNLSNDSGDISKSFLDQSQENLGPAADYLRKVLSGDRNDVMAATMPQRRRVIDQYSAAKKAIAEFTPRGGGQAASGSQLQAAQASDLASLGGDARSGAATALTGLGLNLGQIGVGAQGMTGQNLATALGAMLQKEGQGDIDWASIGMTAGKLIASYYFPPAAATLAI